MTIFIVESPAKIKTLKKIIESLNYKNFAKKKIYFVATLGHVKDLPSKKLGIDTQTFEPYFYFLPGKKKLLEQIKKLTAKATEVYLATDPDREGEAISFHIYETLKSFNHVKFKRIDLIEITKEGFKRAFLNPRQVNISLYEAWKARRVLDRLVGYLISPVLSKNFKQVLSAGRVQSVALRLVVEREREIKNFKPTTYYTLQVELINEEGIELTAELYFKGKLLKSTKKEELINQFKENFSELVFLLEKEEKTEKEYPPYPLKTSTMIEYAQKYLGYEPEKTMYIAQKLYEAGYITYMRTDSVRVSETARKEVRAFIKKIFGEEYVLLRRQGNTGKFVQDAHECIRPTNINIEEIPNWPEVNPLYKLIRSIFIASQMAPAIYKIVNLSFVSDKSSDKSLFLRANLKFLIFPGYLAWLKGKNLKLATPKEFKVKEVFKIKSWKVKKHRTSPPERYTSSSLIKKLESLGIGRPSTYAHLVNLLCKRKYVKIKNKKLYATELGEKVVDFLLTHYPEFVDYNFTSQVEASLEEILQNQKTYVDIVKPIYDILKTKNYPLSNFN